MMKVYNDVFLVSGGVDSVWLALNGPPDSLAVFVDYGQPAAKMERRSARTTLKSVIDIAEIQISGMPLGEMGDGVGAHVVPARNLWLLSLAASFGKNVWIGCGPQDERDYEDCRLEFLHSADTMLRTLGKRLMWSQEPRHVRVEALKERDLLRHCWSCYGPGPDPCGECASCLQ